MSELHVPDPAEREDLGAFAARVVRLDPAAPVRLRARDGTVQAWAQTPFDVLVTRSVHGTMTPPDLTVLGSHLLAALAVARAPRIDPGVRADERWRFALPPEDGWHAIAEVPSAELDGLAERGLRLAREHAAPGAGAPARLLDQSVLTVGRAGESGTVGAGSAARTPIPLRCLFALSGMGFLGGPDPVRVSAAPSWVRLDARFGAVVHRRQALLPLVSVG